MAQHDLVIDNGPGINVRLDINQALQALGSMELGTGAPYPTYPCQRWADLSTGLLKKRNTSDSAWLVDGILDVPAAGGVPVGGAPGAILVKNSAVDGDMVWSTATLFPATGGTITGDLGVTGILTVNGVSVFNNAMNVNGPIYNSVSIQCNVPGGQNALYYGTVAGVRQWYWGVINSGVFWITDATGGANRFQIDTTGTVTIPGKLNCTLQDGIEISVPAGQYARYRSTVAGARTWDFGTYASGIFSIDDISAGLSRLSIDLSGVTTLTALHVNGAFSVAGTFSTAAINGTVITASADFACSPASGAAWYYATAPGARKWQWGSNTDGGFYIYDSSAGASRVIVDTNGDTTILGAAIVNAGINVAVGGVVYTAFDTDRIAFRWNGSNNASLFVNQVNTGSWNVNPSDERLKRNIGAALGDALDELRRLQLMSYDLPDPVHPERPARSVAVGFSAQQMAGVIPEAVMKSPEFGLDPKRDYQANPYTDDEMLLSIDTTPLVARCIAAIQQFASRIETLEGKMVT